ncbi:bifunctional 4-hydroxy-2-oxoglutarate aldolase/2-dehydro-3-deoxy-phosphogluconate aldolase [Roseococcus sp. DSY-14]|uniref:bifunctional 4-hydroxy-2-oxoglutarate aldolase/2-dehydro-3-deoxy-phosphogluconate aldolase n=1 Tax=Roseococcus sp. DSY-14 TaxID=3369650 RepID=UPI00387AC0A0
MIEALRAARILPVIRTATAAQSRLAVEWLAAEGFRTFELTMTTPGALELLGELARDPALRFGMGTVPDAWHAQAAIHAGARFLVTPWVDPEVAQCCREMDTLCMLGAMTPTEVRAAQRAGAGVVKLFPASTAGGPAHLKALGAVFPGVPFCPTGGVEPGNAALYLRAGAAFVGIGGKLADPHALAGNDRATIQAAAREALAITA